MSEEVEDWDAEFAVSTAVQDIAHALEDLGHEVEFIGSGRNLLTNLRKVEDSVDIVFNIAEGYFGRGGKHRYPPPSRWPASPTWGQTATHLRWL